MQVQYDSLLKQSQQEANQLRALHDSEIQQRESQAAESAAAAREVRELRQEQEVLRTRILNADVSLRAMAQRSQSASEDAENHAQSRAQQELDQQRAQSQAELHAEHEGMAELKLKEAKNREYVVALEREKSSLYSFPIT